MMHSNTGDAFLLLQNRFQAIRVITPYRVSLNMHFLGVFPGKVSCVLRAYRWRPSVIHMLYLHVAEACSSSLSPSPTILLSPPYVVSRSPYFRFILQLPAYIR